METNESWISAGLDWLTSPELEPFPSHLAEAITEASPAEIDQAIEQITANIEAIDQPPVHGRLRILMQMLAARTLRLRLEAESGEPLQPVVDAQSVSYLASVLEEANALGAAHCLQILAAQADAKSLSLLCDHLAYGVLTEERAMAIGLSPLFQWPPPLLPEFFEQIGENVWNPQLIGPLLDLAAHACRRGKLSQHPLADQRHRLRELLSSTVVQLSHMEENPLRFGEDVDRIQEVLYSAIALSASLCDALALIGDDQAEHVLHHAMTLSHRRLQTEAAAGLARLGIATGRQRLLELTSDPAARLRAVAYAEELGMDDLIPAEFRSPVAMAQAEVVSWLASSERFGVPPAELALVDQRTQYWPSFDTPQDCFLWQFTYYFEHGELSNFIIAGPLVHAFQADLRLLEPEDVYGLFAGWQVDHDEIYEVPAGQFNSAQRHEADRLLKELSSQGLEDLRPLALAFFFGERAILALGQRDQITVCGLSDALESLIFPVDSRPSSFTPDLVLALYRGKKLLRTFN